MKEQDIKRNIQQAIETFASTDAASASERLLNTLGYYSTKKANVNLDSLRKRAVERNLSDVSYALWDEWKNVKLIFQYSDDEVKKQSSLFEVGYNDTMQSYLFFAVELCGKEYSRSQISNITRFINRLYDIPVMLLFRYSNLLTVSVINRRLHKKDASKDVLEKVTQIKDINIAYTHRAHIEILFDLHFNNLFNDRQEPIKNFEELHNAWKKTLDTKLLNKKFFEELSNWYFWAQGYVAFPNDKKLVEDQNIQINLIRLITRLIFVWFLKEKKLVNENLFEKSYVKKILKTFDSEGGKSKTYYTAILQNLFFATLNQKMTERAFIEEGNFEENKPQYGVKNLYRYADKFNSSKEDVINIFKDIPFLNGGLFDCLDKENEDTGKVEYIDGFSRNAKKVPTVPDLLFFGKERILDLSEGYGYKHNKEKCRGLLEIFSDYKFTIEENTPIEEEIALDPELLGKVFENLLAYYNPETETTARKQTGSFYTPREIVNYMVDESLIAYLKTQMLEDNPAWLQLGNLQSEMFGNEVRKGQLKLEHPLNKGRWRDKKDELENNLRQLLTYNIEPHLFRNEEDVQRLIYAIDHCKILDPACGSGAFPMGILHKLVYVLGKIDREDETGNTRWRMLQKKKAEYEMSKALNEKDKKLREEKLLEINKIFEDNASDYGRKLYLIENCIYGVDIQPIAVQISKLRFFISLVVDQKEKKGSDNRGIRPLPNLETKFVAANTLIGLVKPEGLDFRSKDVLDLENQLRDNRHNHFNAKTRKDKLYCQKQDKAIRENIGEELKQEYSQFEISIQLQIKQLEYQLELSKKAKIREAEKEKFEKAFREIERKLEKLNRALLGKTIINQTAEKISSFDIYDQNVSATWFEPEWMFGKDLEKGFDIVIANPPYIEISGISIEQRNIYKEIYKTAKGRFDLYLLFIEKAMQLKNSTGGFVFIIPGKFLNNKQFESTRKLISQSHHVTVVKIDNKVFEASVDSVIIQNHFAQNSAEAKYKAFKISGHEVTLESETTVSEILETPEIIFRIEISNVTDSLILKIKDNTKRFIEIGEVKDGIIAGLIKDILFVSKKINTDCKPLYLGKQITRYHLQATTTFVDYRPEYALKEELKRKDGGGPGLRMREKRIFERNKIIYRKVGKELIAAFDDKGVYYEQTVHSACVTDKNYRNKFVLGLFNSILFKFYYHKTNSQGGDIFPQIRISSVENLPIKITDQSTQAKFEIIVDYVLCLKRNKRDSTIFERLIDAMVYELYLPEAIQQSNCEVLKHLNNLPELQVEQEEQNLKTIEKVYKELFAPRHPVSAAFLKLLNVEEVNIIEGTK